MNNKRGYKFNLGDHVKDIVTSFEGIIASRSDHITGCDTYVVLPRNLDSKGDVAEGRWFDEGRLNLVKEKVVAVEEVKAERGKGSTDVNLKKA